MASRVRQNGTFSYQHGVKWRHCTKIQHSFWEFGWTNKSLDLCLPPYSRWNLRSAQVHNLNLHLRADEFTVYTDASSIPGDDSNGIGVGLVVPNYNRGTLTVVHTSTTNLGDSQLVYNRELDGLPKLSSMLTK